MALHVSGGSGDLEVDFILNDHSLQATVGRIENQLASIANAANNQSSAIEGFAQKAAIAVGSYLSLNAATDFVKKIIDVRGEIEKLEVSFATMLQSKEKATQLMADVVNLAATTPFTLQEVATGAKQLLAYGTQANKIVDTLKTLGDVAAGVGAPIQDLVYLYGTLQTQGRAYTRDIMQFTSRGIPIIDELAKQFGVTKDKVQGLVEAGRVGFPEIEKAFKSLTGQGGIFFNLMEQQSHTLTGMLSNLSDAFEQMLNDIGRSQEDIAQTGIRGLTSLVKNYQTVLDIIKLLITAYGSYKAILAVTTVTQGLQERAALQAALAGQTLTKSQLAAATAARVLDGTFKTLYSTLASIAPVVALTAVTAAIYSMVTASNAAKDALAKIKDIQSEGAQAAAKEKDTIEQLLKVYNDRNKSDADHAAALQRIIDRNPEYLKGLNANNISTKEGEDIIKKYLIALEDKAKGEAAYAARQANLMKIVDLQSKGIAALDNTEYLGRSLKRFFLEGKANLDQDADIVTDAIKELKDANEKINATFQKQITNTVLGGKADTTDVKTAIVRNEEYLKSEISRITGLRQPLAVSSELYKKYTKDIQALEDELNPKGKLKAENKLYQERNALLKDLAALHRDATQSGLTKEASEIDKINEKYDLTIRKIHEFNATNPNHKVTSVEIQAVGRDRATEINNVSLKQQADDYKKNLDEQKDAFTQYEEEKKAIGIDKANQMFSGQTKGFDTYLDYLESQRSQLVAAATVGGMDIGISEKLKAVSAAIITAQKNDREATQQQLLKLTQDTQTFADKRLAIEQQYQKDISLLEKNFKGEELEKRKGIVTANRADDLNNLKENLSQQSALYQNLNKEILAGALAAFEQRKKLLEQTLKDRFVINIKTGEQIPLTKAQVEALNKSLKDTVKTIDSIRAQQFAKIAQYAGLAANSFSGLASVIKPLNEGLGEAFEQMGNVAGLASQVGSTLSEFAKGTSEGVLAGISSAVGVATAAIGIISGFISANKKHQQEVANFNTGILKGEFDINILYRERALIQAAINKSRLEGLQAETAVLEESLKKNEEDVKRVFDLLQQETFKQLNTFYILDNDLSKKMADAFVRGGGTWEEALKRFGTEITKIVDTPLAGKSFDDMQKLFMNGQLEGKAKELFQTLEKLKQEGVDVDAALAENKRKAQEAYTGTTAQSITDSIRDGFQNGFRSVEEFAGKTKDLVRRAMLSALEAKALTGPIQKIYDQFAIDAESGGGLDATEEQNFENSINKTLENAIKIAEQLEKASGVSLSTAAATINGENSLQGAFKGMTQQSADLMTGQLGGIRLTNLELLDIAHQNLRVQGQIEANTRATNQYLADYFRKWDTIGIPVIIR